MMRQLLCLLGLFVTLTAAQARDARTCRVVFLGAPENAPAKLHLFDGKESREIELPRINFSPVYPLPSGALVIRLLPDEVTNPRDVSPDAPSVAVAKATTDFYLLVSSDTANKITPVKLEIIDATKLAKGQMLWCNLTSNNLDGQLGSQKLELEANARKTLSAPTDKNEDYNVKISFQPPGNAQLQPLCETKWRYDPQSRSVFFVVQKEGERSPRVMGLSDFREPGKRAGKR